MKTILPKGEKIRQTIKWISNEKQDDDTRKIAVLIKEASIRFDLSPLEEDFLYSFFSDKKI
jgi:hypothetical protein